jgi:hypothetical protein
LRYKSIQVQDNLSLFRGSHTYQAGLSFEKYHSLNIFFPSSQSIYTYRSLNDFYADADAFRNNTASAVVLPRFNLRYINQPGLSSPDQIIDVKYIGAYAQDQWRIRENFTLTYGLRMEVPFFGNTGLSNPLVNTLTFRDENNKPLKLATEKLPNSNITWSPRVGFNWNPLKSQRLQLRGGTGIFAARPPFVWISNQIGNNGVLTGVQSIDNTTTRHFNPNPTFYAPVVTGAPVPGQQDLNFTVPEYKFPSLWRSSAGVDYKLPFGLIAGAEYIYSKDVKGTNYINANLIAPDSKFTGPDARPRWVADTCPTVSGNQTRVNCDVVQAITLTNSSRGKAWNAAVTLEKTYSKGFWAKGGYAYGVSKSISDPSSTAGTSFSSIMTSVDPNNPELGFSSANMGHRVFASASYRFEYFGFGGTTVSAFWESKNQRNDSYRYSNDMNGDGISGNDLIYIQKDASETTFVANGAVTAATQSAAWEAFIAQDKYLSEHRGEYALRNAVLYPIVNTLDFSVSQEISVKFWKARHRFQVRADILNFGNLLNNNWGSGHAAANNNFQPLVYAGADAQGRPTFRLNSFGGQLVNRTYDRRVTASDVYSLQLGLRYSF